MKGNGESTYEHNDLSVLRVSRLSDICSVNEMVSDNPEYSELFSEIEDPYIVQIEGNSMIGANIENDDFLLVDAAAVPEDKSIVVAMLNDHMTVKRLSYNNGFIELVPENPNYSSQVVMSEDTFKIVGVVRRIIKEAR